MKQSYNAGQPSFPAASFRRKPRSGTEPAPACRKQGDVPSMDQRMEIQSIKQFLMRKIYPTGFRVKPGIDGLTDFP